MSSLVLSIGGTPKESHIRLELLPKVGSSSLTHSFQVWLGPRDGISHVSLIPVTIPSPNPPKMPSSVFCFTVIVSRASM